MAIVLDVNPAKSGTFNKLMSLAYEMRHVKSEHQKYRSISIIL